MSMFQAEFRPAPKGTRFNAAVARRVGRYLLFLLLFASVGPALIYSSSSAGTR